MASGLQGKKCWSERPDEKNKRLGFNPRLYMLKDVVTAGVLWIAYPILTIVLP